ncbi:hypothetical protein BVY03_05080 [bacterium K02(2017)]|nr:hypothetical protein BVY03_05080 [bacterium K02(2017)]
MEVIMKKFIYSLIIILLLTLTFNVNLANAQFSSFSTISNNVDINSFDINKSNKSTSDLVLDTYFNFETLDTLLLESVTTTTEVDGSSFSSNNMLSSDLEINNNGVIIDEQAGTVTLNTASDFSSVNFTDNQIEAVDSNLLINNTVVDSITPQDFSSINANDLTNFSILDSQTIDSNDFIDSTIPTDAFELSNEGSTISSIFNAIDGNSLNDVNIADALISNPVETVNLNNVVNGIDQGYFEFDTSPNSSVVTNLFPVDPINDLIGEATPDRVVNNDRFEGKDVGSAIAPRVDVPINSIQPTVDVFVNTFPLTPPTEPAPLPDPILNQPTPVVVVESPLPTPLVDPKVHEITPEDTCEPVNSVCGMDPNSNSLFCNTSNNIITQLDNNNSVNFLDQNLVYNRPVVDFSIVDDTPYIYAATDTNHIVSLNTSTDDLSKTLLVKDFEIEGEITNIETIGDSLYTLTDQNIIYKKTPDAPIEEFYVADPTTNIMDIQIQDDSVAAILDDQTMEVLNSFTGDVVRAESFSLPTETSLRFVTFQEISLFPRADELRSFDLNNFSDILINPQEGKVCPVNANEKQPDSPILPDDSEPETDVAVVAINNINPDIQEEDIYVNVYTVSCDIINSRFYDEIDNCACNEGYKEIYSDENVLLDCEEIIIPQLVEATIEEVEVAEEEVSFEPVLDEVTEGLNQAIGDESFAPQQLMQMSMSGGVACSLNKTGTGNNWFVFVLMAFMLALLVPFRKRV